MTEPRDTTYGPLVSDLRSEAREMLFEVDRTATGGLLLTAAEVIEELEGRLRRHAEALAAAEPPKKGKPAKKASRAGEHRHDYGDNGDTCFSCGAVRKRRRRGIASPDAPPVDPRQTAIPDELRGEGS